MGVIRENKLFLIAVGVYFSIIAIVATLAFPFINYIDSNHKEYVLLEWLDEGSLSWFKIFMTTWIGVITFTPMLLKKNCPHKHKIYAIVVLIIGMVLGSSATVILVPFLFDLHVALFIVTPPFLFASLIILEVIMVISLVDLLTVLLNREKNEDYHEVLEDRKIV